jgi:hypothetical protein
MATCPCTICSTPVPDRAYDVLCITCRDLVRAELASMLRLSYWRSSGFAFGESLEHLVRRLSVPKRSFTKSLKVKLPGEYRVPADPSPAIYQTTDFIQPGPVPLPMPDAGPPRDPAAEGRKSAPKNAS